MNITQRNKFIMMSRTYQYPKRIFEFLVVAVKECLY